MKKYKNCEKFLKYFPGKNNPNKHNDWTKTMPLLKPDKPEKSESSLQLSNYHNVEQCPRNCGDMLCLSEVC